MSTARRLTKIVATLGPRTASPDGVRALISAGVDVIRINTSHGEPSERAAWIALVREEAEAAGVAVGVLVDLRGPRIRVGALEVPIELARGEVVIFAPEADRQPGEIPTTYDDMAADVRPGSRILMDDGLLAAEVIAVAPPRVRARVIHGGTLGSSKGINLPGVSVSAPSLTDRDVEALEQARELNVEYVALSFVRRAEDMQALRARLPEPTGIIAKIEKDTALQDIERILSVSDGIMVARGDLGVELPFEQVPIVQKQLIAQANRHGKLVITATQMLESMIHSPRPTRAEASDVANAIIDGTDAVMLSAETAIGDYPSEAVTAMDRIIRSVEAQGRPGRQREQLFPEGVSIEDAIATATTAAVHMLGAPLVVCFTQGGFTARKVSSHRPRVPIVAVTTDALTYRQLSLVWGVVPILVDREPDYESLLDVARDRITTRGYAKTGDCIVVTAGTPWEVSGTTNLLKVEIV